MRAVLALTVLFVVLTITAQASLVTATERTIPQTGRTILNNSAVWFRLPEPGLNRVVKYIRAVSEARKLQENVPDTFYGSTAAQVPEKPVKIVADDKEGNSAGNSGLIQVVNGAGKSHPVKDTRKYDYRAFGEKLTLYEAPGTGEGSGYSENPFGFTGREIEHGTDLYHYRSRSYDPMAGRFLSADPYTSMVMMGQGLSNASAGGLNPLMMGMGSCGAGCGMKGFASSSGGGISRELAGLLSRPLSMNDFGYVMGNPLKLKDPWGLYTLDGAWTNEEKNLFNAAMNVIKDSKNYRSEYLKLDQFTFKRSDDSLFGNQTDFAAYYPFSGKNIKFYDPLFVQNRFWLPSSNAIVCQFIYSPEEVASVILHEYFHHSKWRIIGDDSEPAAYRYQYQALKNLLPTNRFNTFSSPMIKEVISQIREYNSYSWYNLGLYM